MRRKNQKSTALLISWIIGITYIIYIMTYFCIVYFYKAEIAYCWDDTISSHILLAAAGAAFGIARWRRGEQKYIIFHIALTAGAMVLFPLYALFGSLEIIFALIGSQSLRHKPTSRVNPAKKAGRKQNRLLAAAMIVPVLFCVGGCTMDVREECCKIETQFDTLRRVMESLEIPSCDANDKAPNPMSSSSFDKKCGLAASADLNRIWFGYPKLTISLMNPSEKEIEAIAFYLLPYNMYGEEIEGPAISNKLCADTPIPTGESDVISYRLRDRDIKMVQLYVYHVLYSDGTQWGNQNADRADILEDGILIWVSGQL